MINMPMIEKKDLVGRIREYSSLIGSKNAIEAQEEAVRMFGNERIAFDCIPTRVIGMTRDNEVAYLTKSGHVLVTGGGVLYAERSCEKFHRNLEVEKDNAERDELLYEGNDAFSHRIARITKARVGRVLNQLERLRSF